jgi:malonyl-CoA O-methyltransferase
MTMEELASVRHGYDRWAEVYDDDANPLIALEEPHIRQAIGDVRGLSVLDVGCGTGRHSTWLAEAGANVTAIDFSQGMLDRARRKPEASIIRFVVHDITQPLPFKDSSFDIVISGLVLEHIHDLTKFFDEIRRVTRLRGRAIISAMHPAMFLRGSQARFTDPTSGQIVQPGSVNHPLGKMIMTTLQAGFSLEEVEEYAPDPTLAARFARAEKYIGWPMLVILQLRVADESSSH